MRKRMNCLIIATMALTGVSFASLAEFDEVPVTRWVEGGGAKLKTPAEILASWRSDLPFVATEAAAFGRGADKVCIVVNDALYPGIEDKLLHTYIPDLTAEGYAVTVHRSTGGSATDLRNFLIQERQGAQKFTIVLIGDLPVALFEIPGGFENGVPFPCDLFYMDLDGTWGDEDQDGYFDTHEGSVEADARFGRLTAGPLTYLGKTEAELVNHYFDKTHAYRSGQLRAQDKALAYVDDDWEPWGWEWGNNVALAYPATYIYTDKYLTWDTDYETRFNQNYESILVCVHSNPVLHQFVRPGPVYGYTYMSEICNLKPNALFYNLFACSNARFTEANYMAGWYAFMDADYGLAAVGSAKTGSMLHFDDFYKPLGQDKPLGEAFRYWMALWADSNGETSRDWHYGMTVIGDPTLRIRPDYFVGVAVKSFTARPGRDGVTLRWEFTAPGGPVAFNLYRSGPNATPPRRLNDAPIAGRSPLVFTDEKVAPGAPCRYELEVVTGGEAKIAARTAVKWPSARTEFWLSPPAPNPAAAPVRIKYAAAATGPEPRVEVYDLAGRRLKTLTAGRGEGEVYWTLDDERGRRVPPGLYVVRLSQGDETREAPVVVTER